MGALLQRLGVEVPIVQAGMGGGLAGHGLAAAVSAAGGLGTIGILAPDDLRREIAATQKPSRPMFGPAAAIAGGPPNLVAAGPLYAGTCIARISNIRPAGDLVRDLVP